MAGELNDRVYWSCLSCYHDLDSTYATMSSVILHSCIETQMRRNLASEQGNDSPDTVVQGDSLRLLTFHASYLIVSPILLSLAGEQSLEWRGGNSFQYSIVSP